ncbi:MAG: hypothetical protein M0P71_05275 [Melioribacteraceae bacterium]|nr:hypothetical protein [Melioribacteraceae bacterium]
MKINNNIWMVFAMFTCLMVFESNINGQNINDMRRLINLKGEWKFSIGDSPEWSKPNLNDSDWERIKVPSSWESKGFSGYNGYAWYRKKIGINSNIKGKNLYLSLGRIDDVDEVYFNGIKIGFTGKFPPDYQTAYYATRLYKIPLNLIEYNSENSIAIRVYDAEMDGGMLEGNIAVMENTNEMNLDYALPNVWKFSSSDNIKWKEVTYDDAKWDDIMVPMHWEECGYIDYDGYGWYRIKFTLPDKLKNKNLVLVLGKIDDIDETYLNGKLVGSTGERDNMRQSYSQFRGYYLSSDDLIFGKENVLAVRVYDGMQGGGIYDGPLGFISQDKYTKFWREQKSQSNKSFWQRLFN